MKAFCIAKHTWHFVLPLAHLGCLGYSLLIRRHCESCDRFWKDISLRTIASSLSLCGVSSVQGQQLHGRRGRIMSRLPSKAKVWRRAGDSVPASAGAWQAESVFISLPLAPV